MDFYTEREYMMSTMSMLPETLAEASFVISKLLFDNTFEEEKFSQERKIILNELAEASDDPIEKVEGAAAQEFVQGASYKPSSWRFPKNHKAINFRSIEKRT